ncbi:MAG: amidohydrolase [Bacteroidia bacterium]|jgi:predicted amidohydrolase|nr:amidohydrolase [Bacteroidia bacterium]GIV22780.1 MAG: carbon-nitrogen hydrolase [Bacteroidia bacterium]
MAEASVLRVGWIQMDIAWEDPAANVARVEKLLSHALPADVWVLPEMWSTGFSMRTEIAEEEPGQGLRAMQRWAAQQQALFIGSLMVKAQGRYYNRAYAVFPDGSYVAYDKRHLFRMAGEDTYYTAGTRQVAVEWQGWRIAMQVCYDLRFPVWARWRPDYPYDLLVYVANWPAVRQTHWERLLPARAVENLSYVLGVNRIGQDAKGLMYVGGSSLWSFWGEKILSAGETEGAFRMEIALSPLQAYRVRFPAWQDADAFSLV